jgi:hypothetical protein
MSTSAVFTPVQSTARVPSPLWEGVGVGGGKQGSSLVKIGKTVSATASLESPARRPLPPTPPHKGEGSARATSGADTDEQSATRQAAGGKA